MLVLAVLGVVDALARTHLSASPTPYSGKWQPPALEASVALGILLLAVPHPLLAWRLGYVMVLLVPLISGEPRVNIVISIALLVVFIAAGVRHTRLVLWSMWTLMLAPIWIWLGPRWVDAALATAALTVFAVALDARAATRRAGHALAEQVAATEHEEARRAVLEERARIAREMHDVVAHHMSLMAVAAETAPYRLAPHTERGSTELPESIVAEFASLSNAARAALADLRSLLGVLRNDEEPSRTPQPRLSDVPQLVNATRHAGIEVELSMPGGDDDVPAAVGLCAYRIIQEALSNAGRHAPSSRVTIIIGRDHRQIRIDVTNGPTAIRSAAAMRPYQNPAGHGIVGMRERVTLLGGSLSVLPTPDRGYAVIATIPLARP
ncbi:MAG: sensor histidine kinase [Solirubrobacteraceae bacterium]